MCAKKNLGNKISLTKIYFAQKICQQKIFTKNNVFTENKIVEKFWQEKFCHKNLLPKKNLAVGFYV